MTITYMVSLNQLQMKKEVIIISPYIRSQNRISHNQHLLVAYRSKTLMSPVNCIWILDLWKYLRRESKGNHKPIMKWSCYTFVFGFVLIFLSLSKSIHKIRDPKKQSLVFFSIMNGRKSTINLLHKKGDQPEPPIILSISRPEFLRFQMKRKAA